MSEQIIITVHGKFHERDSFIRRRLTAQKGENLLRVLKKNGYYERDCSGNGTCGKCVVRFIKDAPLPTTNERVLLSTEALRKGCRLACRHALMRDAEIVLEAQPEKLPDVITDVVKEEGRQLAKGAFETPFSQRRTSVSATENETAQEDGSVFFVADVGTTTVAMQAVRNGETVGTFTALNPQRSFGADVASRISAAMQGHRQEMTAQITDCLKEGAAALIKQCEAVPEFMVIVGNTAMNYSIRGLDPKVLGVYPFSPVDTKPAQITLAGIRCYIIPGISAFVGGDIVSGIIAMDMTKDRKCRMLVDLGTNGEMVLGKGERLLCTATAAGPAFEGSAAGGIMGADLIGITARLLDRQLVDATGLLCEPYFTEGVKEDGICVRQTDIRELQKAKAAIAAGIACLCDQCKITEDAVETVYLAGGFGYYLNPESAIRIGLFPENWHGRIVAVGNSALAGAKQIGEKMLGQDEEEALRICRTVCGQVQSMCDSINLAEEPDFTERYMDRVSFPDRA